MSVVAGHIMVSLPVEDKVKGFEKNISKIVGTGIKAETNTKLDKMEDDETIKPTKKKAQLEGKENKVPPNLQKGDPITERNQVGIIIF
jgi:hypothetical protein